MDMRVRLRSCLMETRRILWRCQRGIQGFFKAWQIMARVCVLFALLLSFSFSFPSLEPPFMIVSCSDSRYNPPPPFECLKSKILNIDPFQNPEWTNMEYSLSNLVLCLLLAILQTNMMKPTWTRVFCRFFFLSPPWRSSFFLCSNAVLSFAVKTLKVRHVIVMGHYGCGGVAASMVSPTSQSADLAVQKWISPIREIYETSTRFVTQKFFLKKKNHCMYK